MKKSVCLALGVGLAALASGPVLAQAAGPAASAESWTAVSFRAPSAEEQRIVTAVYGEFLREAPDTRVEVARVDVNGDRTAEVFVRMTHPRLCGASGCHTALLMWVPEGSRRAWKPILERRSTAVEIGRGSQGQPSAARIRVNGRELWEMTPAGTYAALARSFGEPVPLRAGAPAPVVQVAVRAANQEAGGGIRPDMVFAAQAMLGPARVWLAQVSSGMLCGQVGCPVFVISGEGTPRLLGQFSALEGGLYMGRWPDGGGMIAAQGPQGVTLYSFANGRVVIRETTFPSDVTPTP